MWFLKHGSSFVSIASRRESLHPRSPTRVHSAVASSASGDAGGGGGSGGGGRGGGGAALRLTRCSGVRLRPRRKNSDKIAAKSWYHRPLGQNRCPGCYSLQPYYQFGNTVNFGL